MKLLFVVGGSYKGFYLNQIKKIKDIDLLIFQQNIFYEFNYEQELLGDGVVSKELKYLNDLLKCPIVVFGVSNFLNKRQKCIIVCINGKVSVYSVKDDIYLFVKGKNILIGNKLYKYTKSFATISLLDFKLNDVKKYKNVCHNYFLCDKLGVTHIKKGQIYRKFRKCCYFTLYFNKKMI